MSLMIKGFEFPQSCRECWFVYPEWLHNCSCIFTDKYWEFEEEMPSKSRLPECPLVEIPTPHGRLIDADKFLKDNAEFAGRDFIHPSSEVTLRELIDEAPTIIKAEVSEE